MSIFVLVSYTLYSDLKQSGSWRGRGLIQSGYCFNLNPQTLPQYTKKIIDIWLNKICERETSASACPLTKEQVVAVGWVVRGASKQLMSRRVVTSKSWLGWNSRLKTQTAHNAEFMMIDVNKNKKILQNKWC